MRTFVLMAVVTLAPACAVLDGLEDESVRAGNDEGPTGGTCTDVGQFCGDGISGPPCCGSPEVVCFTDGVNGVCEPEQCRLDGLACDPSRPCCSGDVCVVGEFCGGETACAQDGMSCDVNSQCCGGACNSMKICGPEPLGGEYEITLSGTVSPDCAPTIMFSMIRIPVQPDGRIDLPPPPLSLMGQVSPDSFVLDFICESGSLAGHINASGGGGTYSGTYDFNPSGSGTGTVQAVRLAP